MRVPLLLLSVLALGSGALAPAYADFYVGADLGVAESGAMDYKTVGQSTPTRCDVLMYDDATRPTMALANDPACSDFSPRKKWEQRFDAGSGLAAGVHVGYIRDRLRFELEFMHVKPGSTSERIRTASTDPGLEGKLLEWSDSMPPWEWIDDFRLRQFFANVFYDFASDSAWTPYVGAGVGWARARMQLRRSFLRKTEAEGYLLVAPEVPTEQAGYGWTQPTWDEWREEAAGTLTYMSTKLSDTLFGFQLLAGLDYALSAETAVGVKLRWAQFDDLESPAPYSRVRDHPAVLTDGVSPFIDHVTFDGVEYWAVTLGFKRRF